ncbi:MAG: FtsX-like permease family protein [Chloroherpetonaceae bacterium]|nr:FtsX-like permease family protein [Chloroherpetonaceae bacterium]
MMLLKIFWQVSLRHARNEWGKFLLSVFGIAVGVAVFLSIRLSNHSAYKSFESTIDQVNGKANAQVQSKSGTEFSQSVFRQIIALKDRLPALKAATPVTEQTTRPKGISETLIVLGIDIFSDRAFRTYEDLDGADSDTFLRFLLEPNTLIVSQQFAARNHLKKGDTLELLANGVLKPVKIIGVFKTDRPTSEVANSFAVMDIEQAQRLFGKEGKLDKIDLIISEAESARLKAYLSEVLPPDVEVVSAKNRGEQVAKMLAAFEMNLAALAFISLLVAMFLIYNTITTNAIRRRREIGILRALGLSAWEVFSLFLLEAALIGILGSAVGLALGIALAHYTLQSIAETISALYIYVAATAVRVKPSLLLAAFSVGVMASIVSALFPAWEVFKVHPRETFHIQAFEQRTTLNLKRILAISLVLLMMGIVLAQLPSVGGKPIFGYASAICAILGFALLSPEFIALSRPFFERIAYRIFGIEGKLAASNLADSLNRAATAVSALMVAVAMLIGISVMVGSFRQTVIYWVEQTLKADVFIAPAERFGVGAQAPISREVLEYVAALPETKAVDAFSSRAIRTQWRTHCALCAKL